MENKIEKSLFYVKIGTETRKGNLVNVIEKVCTGKNQITVYNYYRKKYLGFDVRVDETIEVPEDIPEVVREYEKPTSIVYDTGDIKIEYRNVAYLSNYTDEEKIEIQRIRGEVNEATTLFKNKIEISRKEMKEMIEKKYPYIEVQKHNIDFTDFCIRYSGRYRHGIKPMVSEE